MRGFNLRSQQLLQKLFRLYTLMSAAVGGAYLQVEGSTRFGHLTEEMFVKTRAQDVLSVRLIGVKGQLLSIKPHIRKNQR